MAYLLQQLQSASAERHADKPAVWAQGRTLTHGQLEADSNRLALCLQARGIGRGDRVGLWFPKAVESIVAMLGILKCGASYVPLDPMAPPMRIASILADCSLAGLITDATRLHGLDPSAQQSLRLRLLVEPATADASTLSWDTLGAFPDTPPAVDAVESDLAYILYTSGSTGNPKGVMISHRNALTFVDWCADTFRVTASDRLSNHAPLHFDLSVFDVYNALEAGACVFLIPESVAVFPANMAAFIAQHGISIWYSVPSALVSLLLHGGLETRELAALRLVLFAGEVLPMKYLRRLTAALPRADFYNLYGPTETNVCTYYPVDRAALAQVERLPIGRACANTEVFALDAGGARVQPGQEGELYVRGPSVTSGYWGDAEKTARSVVPHPLHSPSSEKVYRTGDLVVLRSDGDYDFVGRRDSMVKSRGYRIELGDIESALYLLPGVREAAAVAIPDPEIGCRLIAFVVPHQPDGLSVLSIQQHCSERIPKYMIPEKIILCDGLPRTSTGKVDRTRLARDREPGEAST